MGLVKKEYLKEETESTIIAAQDQALCTRNMVYSMWYMERTLIQLVECVAL